MLRKPLLVHSKMVNICCQLFPSPSQMDLVQFFVSQNISTISLLVKWILKYIVYKRQRQEECFLSCDAPFAKSILFMRLHLLRYTWHCASKQNIVLIRHYLLPIFHFFTTQMQVLQTLLQFLEKLSMHYRRSFCFCQILTRQYHNHLEHNRR